MSLLKKSFRGGEPQPVNSSVASIVVATGSAKVANPRCHRLHAATPSVATRLLEANSILLSLASL